MASGPGGAFTPDSNDVDLSATECSFPSCSRKPAADKSMCTLHMDEQPSQRQPSKSGLGYHASKATLLPDGEPGSVRGITRRKTGPTFASHAASSSSAHSHRLKTSGTSGAPPKETSHHANSPPDSSNEAGPIRKKARINPSADAKGEGKTEYFFKKPWDKKLQNTKVQVHRKIAPRVSLEFRPPSPTRKDAAAASVPDSPLPGGSTPRDEKIPSESPQREGREFSGNQSVRAYFSQKPLKSESFHEHLNRKRSRLSTGPAEKSSPARSTSSVVEDMRPAGDNHWLLPPSLVAPSPKSDSSRYFQPQHSSKLPKEEPVASNWFVNRLLGRESIPGKERPAAAPAKTISELDFDSLIYAQEGAAPPPKGVIIKPRKVIQPPPRPKPEPPDEPFYAHIDPRLHWSQPQTAAWREKKMREIEARGGRKANFGKAAQRLKQQHKSEGPRTFEDTLPPRIRENEAWVRALKSLNGEEAQEDTSKRRTGQRGPKAGRQGLKRQASTTGPTTPKKP